MWIWGVVVASLVSATPAEQTFCERMASQLSMQPVERGRQGQTTGEWRVNVLSGLKNALFGGSVLVSFGMKPVGVVTDPDEYTRLQKTCEQRKKSIFCQVEGPMILTVSTGKGTAEIEARTGERAQVEMKGTSIYCRDSSAFTTA